MTLGRKNIVDEDKYLEDLDFIIRRDFFPDSELVQLQLKYFDAMEAQDFCALKEIQMKLNRINETFDNNRYIISTPKSVSSSMPYKNPSVREARDLHLDEYLALNTSEDNASYSDLQQKTIERQMNKLAWAFKAAKEYNSTRFKSLEDGKNLLAIMDKDDGKKTSNSTNLENFLEYKVFNPVFFNPDSAPLSAAERVSLAGKKHEINYEITRFKRPIEIVRSRPKTTQVKSKVPGKIGHDGKELTNECNPMVNGFSILGRMDTPDDLTPQTTWGCIDGTPLALPDSPFVSRFRMQELSEREKIANEMASKVMRNKNKKEHALNRVRSNLNRPTSSRSIISPAAIRLLSRMTPSTPKSSLNSRPNSSILLNARNTPSVHRNVKTPNGSITDNLLDI